MPDYIDLIPEMEVGLVVITPNDYRHITANKKYIVEKVDGDMVYIENDVGRVELYKSFRFIDANLYFTMCLFSTVITLFKLGNRAYK